MRIHLTKRARSPPSTGHERTCEWRLAAKGEMDDVTNERLSGMRSEGSGPERANDEKPRVVMTAEMIVSCVASTYRRWSSGKYWLVWSVELVVELNSLSGCLSVRASHS